MAGGSSVGCSRGCSVPALLSTLLVVTLFNLHVQCWRIDIKPISEIDFTGKDLQVKHFVSEGPDYFKVFLTDTFSDTVLIGAKNRVYNVSMMETHSKSLLLKVNYEIAWNADNHVFRLCRSRRKTKEECQNYIRVLYYTDTGDLFICGTNAFKPSCRGYKPVPDAKGQLTVLYEKSGLAVCPYSPLQNSTFTYADGELYAGTVADVSGRDSLIYRTPTRTVQHDSQMLNSPDFVASFEHGEHVYFFFRESAVENINCGKAIFARVGRVCKSDMGGFLILRKSWTSFFKVRLNCSLPGNFPFYFDEIQAATPVGSGHFKPMESAANATDVIYAVFNTPENSITGSAVCAFRLSDIISSFDAGFKEQKNVFSLWLPVSQRDTPRPHPTQCVNDSKALPIQAQSFIKSHPLMDRAVPAFGNQPILIQTREDTRLVQIAVDWQRQAVNGKFYDILFVGNDDGLVIKAINRGFGSKMDTVVIEEIRVFPHRHAITGLYVYRSHEIEGKDLVEHLTVVSRSEIKIIPLYRCKNQEDCDSCVKLRDPYCSWDGYSCTANSRSGTQHLEAGTDCKSPASHLKTSSILATSPSSPAPTSSSCVCPEQRVEGHPTVDPQPATAATTTAADEKTANRIEDPSSIHPNNVNRIPNVGQQRTDPAVGAATQVRGDMVSASTLALSLIFSIVIALIIGFLAGYRTSVYRNKGHPDHELFMCSPKPDPLKNLNRFEDSNRYNTHDYLPQPRQVKQLNVVCNPLKHNSKLPNGSAQTEVQKQKAKKVYL